MKDAERLVVRAGGVLVRASYLREYILKGERFVFSGRTTTPNWELKTIKKRLRRLGAEVAK